MAEFLADRAAWICYCINLYFFSVLDTVVESLLQCGILYRLSRGDKKQHHSAFTIVKMMDGTVLSLCQGSELPLNSTSSSTYLVKKTLQILSANIGHTIKSGMYCNLFSFGEVTQSCVDQRGNLMVERGVFYPFHWIIGSAISIASLKSTLPEERGRASINNKFFLSLDLTD